MPSLRSGFRWNASILLLLLLSPAFLAAQEVAPAPDPKEIVRRGVEADEKNFEIARNYTGQRRAVIKEFEKSGKVKKQFTRTYDVTVLYGQEYSRLIQKDDRPLSADDEKKEQEKLDKFIAKHKSESADEHRKHLEKQEKEKKQDRAFIQDLVNAYDFQIVGEEKIDGREMWVIEANPRKDFHPTQPHADILPKLKGKLWIDKHGYEWVRAEAEAIDTISFGLFLARLHKGSRLTFEQSRVNDEVWLPKRTLVAVDARIMLFKNAAFENETTYSNYKKFVIGTKILPGMKEVTP